jgi:XTP/dITP diphosphohydrolase
VFTLIAGSQISQFTGTVTGHIAENPTGENGFGYDPVFVPDGDTRTFAEMSPDEKSAMSHRTKAFRLLIAFIADNF